MRVFGAPGDPSTAMWQTVPSLDMTFWISQAPVDVLLLDMEHGDFSLRDVRYATWIAHAAQTATIVRLPDGQAQLAGSVLDQGVDGVVLPNVESKSEVERLLSASTLPPDGCRGLSANALTLPSSGLARALVGIQIESEGVLGDLAALLGDGRIDFVMPGPRDLAARGGHEGNGTGDETAEAVRVILEYCASTGIPTIMPRPREDMSSAWHVLDKMSSMQVIGHDHALVESSLLAVNGGLPARRTAAIEDSK